MRECMFYFGGKAQGSVGTPLQIPVESGVVVGARFLVILDYFKGHEEASLNSAA